MGLFDSKTKSESYAGVWGPAQWNLEAATRTIGGVQQTPFQFYPGQTYAPQTQAEMDAINMMMSAGDIMNQYFAPTQAYQNYLYGMPEQVLNMGLQDVANNPYLADVAGAIESQVMRNFEENLMPGLDTPGQMGGTRQGVAQGIAARGTSETLSEQLAGLYGGAWQAGLGAETARLGQALSAGTSAMQLTPTMANMAATLPAEMMYQAGMLERAEEQKAIDEAMARHEFEQMEPWTRAGMTFETLMPAATSFGSNVTKGTSTPSPFQQIGGGLALGGSLFGMGSQLFGMGGTPMGYGGYPYPSPYPPMPYGYA